MYYYDDYDDQEPDKESPKKDSETSSLDFLVTLLNFLGFLNTGDEFDRADDLTVPAELTMMAVGLYGIYFAAVGWDLSNRRKKREAEGDNLGHFSKCRQNAGKMQPKCGQNAVKTQSEIIYNSV